MFTNRIYIYIYKPDLALNNLQWFRKPNHNPNPTLIGRFFVIKFATTWQIWKVICRCIQHIKRRGEKGITKFNRWSQSKPRRQPVLTFHTLRALIPLTIISDHREWNKGRSSKFCVGSRVQQEAYEEGRGTHQSKRCEYKNKCEDNSLKTPNDKKSSNFVSEIQTTN